MTDRPRQLHFPGLGEDDITAAVARAFDPGRLTQARLLADMTKSALASEVHLSAAAIGQFESGVSKPRPDHLPNLASALKVPVTFFAVGRPHAQVDAGAAHFRKLRSTRVGERAKALAYVEQVWELVNALEIHVEFPPLNLPSLPQRILADPPAAARAVRRAWNIAPGPLPHLVRTMEIHGVIVTLLPLAKEESARIDAFSTSRLPRPIVVLTPDRADNVYRHRFTAAHELGHILMHHEVAPGELKTENEASAFAAELLAPADEISTELSPKARIHELNEIGQRWGISIKALITRSRELGLTTDVTARRAYQRLNQIESAGLLPDQPITAYPGETPSLLGTAFELAEQNGLTLAHLAQELAWPLQRVRQLLGQDQGRPSLRLVQPGQDLTNENCASATSRECILVKFEGPDNYSSH
jgi:Zn-dependent peptidase ImmA (M78 family)/transcriptional regulator with XRE-family HTH domain